MKFNNQETTMVLHALIEYIEIMESGEETNEYTHYMVENGLGSAVKKLSKGKAFSKYPSHRESFIYPTFEEWKIKNKTSL